MSKPELRVFLDGPGGNIFSIMFEAADLLGKRTDEAREMIRRVQEEHTYANALEVIKEYVDLKLL